ncbi:uroporphyrinogen-III synthase [Schauerella aestuarii]|uniref:uroporphyrinogen-III synthase n=1 Tax=Schauerella aestuarii TaxID=2511204 RepID=UPI00136D2922|nr:uroporphyrinogen-III synthase [Achromobacter aestuarii]MYZ46079.1 uroporphyrinogen-III synthase [Achromobacter aestuarii]
MSPIAVLTRPAGRNDALAALLAARQWTPVILPALRIERLAPNAAAFPHPSAFDLIVFVSGQAARAYAEQWRACDPAGRWPVASRVAGVGEATAQAIALAGLGVGQHEIVVPDALGASRDSESLWPAIAALQPFPKSVLIVRGETGREWLAQRLRDTGASVTIHAAYGRHAVIWTPAEIERVQGWAARSISPTWLLTSRESIDSIMANLNRAGALQWWRHCTCVVTHEKLAAYLRALPTGGAGAPVVKTCLPTDAAMFNAFVAT